MPILREGASKMYLATIIFEVWFHHQRNSHVVFKECLKKVRIPHFQGFVSLPFCRDKVFKFMSFLKQTPTQYSNNWLIDEVGLQRNT